VTEPLILQMECQQGFRINNECKIASLAFADDIILLAQDVPEARKLLEMTEGYLEKLNMKISAPKCAAFQICTSTNKDSWYLVDPLLATASGDRIPNIEAEATIKYLGGKISPWKGLIDETLERVRGYAFEGRAISFETPPEGGPYIDVYNSTLYVFNHVGNYPTDNNSKVRPNVAKDGQKVFPPASVHSRRAVVL
jgi:hypothetical protein